MLKLRTSVPAFRSKRNWKADKAADFGWLKRACIVFGLLVAAEMPAAGQGFTVIHDFAGYTTQGGAEPSSGPIQATDGNFYGATSEGGGGTCTFGCGTIYQITADGAFSVLYSFPGPWGAPSSLIQASDGNLYGTTIWGGGSSNCSSTDGCGAVYRITLQGVFTTLYSFNKAAGPSSLIEASDGNFYGTTNYGGPSTNCYLGCGTIFRLTPGGALTTLYIFSGSDGSQPGQLIQATDGNFYGITGGGANGDGTVFKLTAGAALTTLYSFRGADGFEPTSLIQVKNGNFYGLTVAGGAYNAGTAFELTSTGTLTPVYSFCAQKQCADGNEPITLMQASDGNLYGTTVWGGNAPEGGGTIFEISGGTLTTIHKFTPTSGSYLGGSGPEERLVQAADGSFYSTTFGGGTNNNCGNNCGTVFTFGPATATLSRTSSTFGNQALNETSAAASLTLKNNGVTLLNVSNVALTGEFAIATNQCTGRSLSSGQACSVSVTFTPTALGLQTGTLSFTDNVGTSPQTVTFSGTGVEPATVTPTSAIYIKRVVGTTSSAKTFILANHQNVTLTGLEIATTGDFAISATTCSTSLAAKKQCAVSVTFTPTQPGTRTGTLSFSDSAANSPQVVTFTGTGASN